MTTPDKPTFNFAAFGQSEDRLRRLVILPPPTVHYARAIREHAATGVFWLPPKGSAHQAVCVGDDCPMCQRGLKVTVSKARNVVQYTARKHRKRRNQTEQYHRRVQKKWDKRVATGDKHPSVCVADPLVFKMSLKMDQRIQDLVEDAQ